MQTSYSINQAVGKVGMIVDASFIKDVETFKNPAGEVLFGHVVTKGAATDEIVHPDAATEITDEKLVRGVVLNGGDMESQAGTGKPGYVANSVVPVMRKGRVWVNAEDIISEGTSTVNVRYAGGQLGSLLGAAVSAATAVLPKSKWKTSTTANGQLAVLEIDL